MFNFHRQWRKSLKITTELSIVRIFISLGLAGIDTIWALYLSSYGLSDSMVGFLSASFILVALVISFYSTIILEKINEYKLLVGSLIIYILVYLIFSQFKNIYLFLGLCVIMTIIAVFRRESFNILFRDNANDKTLNEEEGLLFTLLNISWVIGPLIAGFILATYNLQKVFLSSAGFMSLALILLMNLNIKKIEKKRENLDENILSNLKDYIKKKELNISYLIGTGIEIWWALIYIYIPLFIVKEGLGEEMVGIFLSGAIIPLVLFEYKFSKLSQKKGFKKFFVYGFAFLGVCAIIGFLSQNIYFTLIVISLASLGMAALEPLMDTYFFKQVKSNEEEKFYPIFSTSAEIGSFLGKIAIAGILLFFANEYAYLIIGIFMFIISGICFKYIKN